MCVCVCLCLCLRDSASEWEELGAAGPERRSMEDGVLRGMEQLAGALCLQAAGILQVSTSSAACEG